MHLNCNRVSQSSDWISQQQGSCNWSLKAAHEAAKTWGKTTGLQRAKLMREQYGFALNREERFEEAEKVLKGVIEEYGPSSETNGLQTWTFP